MKYALALVLLLLPFVSDAQNSPTQVNFDGDFWSRLDEGQRSSYVFGFISGYDKGYSDARTEASLLAKEPPWWPRSSSMGDIKTQVDKFYADYRNTPVCMDDAVYEAANSLEGRASTDAALTIRRAMDGIKKCK